MKGMLLISAALVAATALATPAAAQSRDGFANGASSGGQGDGWRSGHRDGDPRDLRRHRNGGDTFFFAPEAWALYNNRSWAPDSYNDWWHDRPDRAYPRWVQQNQNCMPDRMWWSGSGWHC